ncbi:MAG: nucleoside triphosphate pyrophosphohydrolase [Bacteroidia bacterium]|jgi:XTP/dITP diphosphohydrolase|nr:nucleoside triphosphate pyrophosphohydrolase [Bacteroidia bacterium]
MRTKLDTAAFERIIQIMDELREQCPWDKKQTWESLRPLTIEETYELSDAIINKDFNEIKKELGDVFLHILFYSRLASEEGKFDINDVVRALAEKLIHRHPHIYGNVEAHTEEQVKENWEKIKQKERTQKKGVLSGVPQSLPSIIKSYRIQEKAAAVGFDWPEKNQVIDKVKEELEEFLSAVQQNTSDEHIEEEFGDVLFSLINLARFLKVNPDTALEKVNQKFTKRFNYIEEQLMAQNKTFEDVSLDEMERYWTEAKKLGM